MIIQLIKRSESYEHIGKRLKFLADLLRILTLTTQFKLIIHTIIRKSTPNWLMTSIKEFEESHCHCLRKFEIPEHFTAHI